MSRKIRHLNLSIVALIVPLLAILACTAEQKLGKLNPLDTNPITFTLLGEVSHTWQASVSQDNIYTVVLTKINFQHPTNQIEILVEQADRSDITFIGTPIQFSESTVTTTFTAPHKGTSIIIVSSKIGENQEDLGKFSIQLVQTPK
jgi:hypothetical protein